MILSQIKSQKRGYRRVELNMNEIAFCEASLNTIHRQEDVEKVPKRYSGGSNGL